MRDDELADFSNSTRKYKNNNLKIKATSKTIQKQQKNVSRILNNQPRPNVDKKKKEFCNYVIFQLQMRNQMRALSQFKDLEYNDKIEII